MTNNRTSKAVLKWEQRLRAEGLAPLDQQTVWRGGSVRQDRYEQRTSGRLCVVVRTEIITPLLPYLPEPERLRAALEQWITGNASGFTRVGQALLGYTGNQSSPRR